MASLDGKRGVLITEDAARRIARAVQRINNANRDSPGIKLRTAYDDGGGDKIKLGKVSAAWDKGTLASVTIYAEGTPPDEEAGSDAEVIDDCVNKFADIDADSWVMVAELPNGSWYVIAAECDPEEGSS
jgi:hypothetical protein